MQSTVEPLQLSVRRRVTSLCKTLAPLLQLNVEIRVAVAFLLIASRPDSCTVRELSSYLGTPPATTARILQRLSDGAASRHVGKGLGLVRCVPDELVPQRNRYLLTKKGARLLAQVLAPRE